MIRLKVEWFDELTIKEEVVATFVIEDWKERPFQEGFEEVEGLVFDTSDEAHQRLCKLKGEGRLTEKAVVVMKCN